MCCFKCLLFDVFCDMDLHQEYLCVFLLYVVEAAFNLRLGVGNVGNAARLNEQMFSNFL